MPASFHRLGGLAGTAVVIPAWWTCWNAVGAAARAVFAASAVKCFSWGVGAVARPTRAPHGPTAQAQAWRRGGRGGRVAGVVAGVAPGVTGVAGMAGVARTQNEAIAFKPSKASAVNAAPVLPGRWQRRRVATRDTARQTTTTNHNKNNEKPPNAQSKIGDSRTARCRRARRKRGTARGGGPIELRRTVGGEWSQTWVALRRTREATKHPSSGDHPDQRRSGMGRLACFQSTRTSWHSSEAAQPQTMSHLCDPRANPHIPLNRRNVNAPLCGATLPSQTNWPPLCCLSAKVLKVTGFGHDIGLMQSTTILTQWG